MRNRVSSSRYFKETHGHGYCHAQQPKRAHQTGIPQTTIRNILPGITTRPQSNTANALTKYYGISQRQLMGEAFIDYEKNQTQFLPMPSQPQPAPDINTDLLTNIIITLEPWLDDHCLTLAAEKRAKIIQILYCDYIDHPEQKITASQIKNLFGLSAYSGPESGATHNHLNLVFLQLFTAFIVTSRTQINKTSDTSNIGVFPITFNNERRVMCRTACQL